MKSQDQIAESTDLVCRWQVGISGITGQEITVIVVHHKLCYHVHMERVGETSRASVKRPMSTTNLCIFLQVPRRFGEGTFLRSGGSGGGWRGGGGGGSVYLASQGGEANVHHQLVHLLAGGRQVQQAPHHYRGGHVGELRPILHFHWS